jgi:hypothetical protein
MTLHSKYYIWSRQTWISFGFVPLEKGIIFNHLNGKLKKWATFKDENIINRKENVWILWSKQTMSQLWE